MKTATGILLLVALITSGCGSNGGGKDDAPSSNIVGVGGGTATSADQRASVEIPPGALGADTEIIITSASGPSNGLVGAAYAFGPSGLTFALPVTLTVVYTPAEIPASLGEGNLGLGLLTGGEWHLIDGSTTDTSRRRVRAATTHFSVFGVIGRAMYISDTGPNHRIVRTRDFTDEGWTTYDGTSGSDDPLDHPLGMVATDQKKRLLITEWGNGRIVRFNDMEGSGRLDFGTDGSGVNQFHHPAGITVDSKGRIYIADLGNNRLVRIDDLEATNNGWTTYDGLDAGPDRQLQSPAGITVDHSDRIYLTDRGNHRVVRMDDMDGAGWTSVGSRGPGEWQFQNPAGITVDAQGRVFVSDWGNHRIVRIDDLDTMSDGWTTHGTLGTSVDGAGKFNNPAGIALDPRGRIHVVDRENNRVVRINDMTGDGWISFGSFGSGVGQFVRPVGIALAVEANK